MILWRDTTTLVCDSNNDTDVCTQIRKREREKSEQRIEIMSERESRESGKYM